MASLDEEFALFEAELKSLEQTNKREREESDEQEQVAQEQTSSLEPPAKKQSVEAAASNSSSSTSSSKGNSNSTKTTITKVIAAAPRVYAAPPRPLASVIRVHQQVAGAYQPTSESTTTMQPSPGTSVAGALSGFPMGTTGEDISEMTSKTTERAPRPLFQRVDMVTGQLLSAEEQQMMNSQQSVYGYDPNKQTRTVSREGSYAALQAANAAQTSNGGSNGADAQGRGGKAQAKRNIRMGGGEVWVDPTLDEWPDNDFRLFCGDLGNEVSDELLAHSFSRYPSFQKAKVVRDKYNHKSKGYGFVSFADPFDCAKALREMNGKYIGNRPVKIRKSKWEDRNIDVARKKMKKRQKNKHLHLFN